MNEGILDLIETSDNTIKYFIDTKKSPALCIATGVYSPRGNYTLFFGRGIITEFFVSKQKAKDRAIEIFKKTNKSITVTVVEQFRKEKLLSFEQEKMSP